MDPTWFYEGAAVPPFYREDIIMTRQIDRGTLSQKFQRITGIARRAIGGIAGIIGDAVRRATD